MLFNSFMLGIAVSYTVLFGGVAIIIARVNKKTEEYNKIWRDKLEQETKEHRDKMDEVFATHEEQLEEVSTNLTDDEVLLLDDLFRRAKKDDRFKEKLEDIRLTDIYYEAMEVNCKRVRESMDRVCKIIDKWENGGDSNE